MSSSSSVALPERSEDVEELTALKRFVRFPLILEVVVAVVEERSRVTSSIASIAER